MFYGPLFHLNRMKRIVILSLLLIILVPCLNAQRKEIGQARTFMKSGKNFDRAEKLMRDLLKDSANQENLKIHSILCDALRKQYEAGNMKMYLKQKVDTAQLFHLTRTMFMDFETLDSLDARPNKKCSSSGNRTILQPIRCLTCTSTVLNNRCLPHTIILIVLRLPTGRFSAAIRCKMPTWL